MQPFFNEGDYPSRFTDFMALGQDVPQLPPGLEAGLRARHVSEGSLADPGFARLALQVSQIQPGDVIIGRFIQEQPKPGSRATSDSSVHIISLLLPNGKLN